METVTLTFNPNSPFASSMEAFLKTVPKDVKVTKNVKAKAKLTSKEELLAEIAKGAEEARRMAKRPHKTYSAEEISDAV